MACSKSSLQVANEPRTSHSPDVLDDLFLLEDVLAHVERGKRGASSGALALGQGSRACERQNVRKQPNNFQHRACKEKTTALLRCLPLSHKSFVAATSTPAPHCATDINSGAGYTQAERMCTSPRPRGRQLFPPPSS